MRSCHSGYWRFFANDLGIITPGRYYFVPDTNPHLNDFHYFGAEDWRQDLDERVVGVKPPPVLGNDKALGWKWDNGKAPALLPPVRSVGTFDQFQQDQHWPVGFERKLVGGIDSRCYIMPQGFLVADFRELADDNCAWLLILCGIIQKMESGDKATVTTALQMIFGPGTTINFRDPDADNNMIVVAQTPRNNIVIVAGTHSWDLLARQLLEGMSGPTVYPLISTHRIHWNAALVMTEFMNTVGCDLSKPTLLSGHSMGAATVMIGWDRFRDADPARDMHVITFGMPKPGDVRFADHWAAHGVGVSVVNHGDPVPRIPPANTLRDAVRGILPWIPNTWFGTYQPIGGYLHILPGGEFVYAPIDELSPAALIGFVVAGLIFGDEDPQSSHQLPSYISHLQLHCPFVEPPFSAELYDLLFGHHQFRAGGIELGGFGAIVEPGPAALVFGGGGISPATMGLPAQLVLGGAAPQPAPVAGVELGGAAPIAAPAGGIELGGGGDLVLADADGGVELNGEGVITREPGADCDHALTLTLGETFAWTTDNGNQQWYKIAMTNGTLYKLTMSAVTWSNLGIGWSHGASCSSTTGIFPVPSSITPCVEYTATADENMYVQISGGFFGDTDYTISIDTGHC